MAVFDEVTLDVAPWAVQAVKSTGSTNADLVVLARDGGPAWSALVAGEQTAGRGRLTRTWSSPPGTSVSISVLLRPSRPVVEWGLLPLLTGLGVARAVASLGAVGVLKWPNDVLLPADGERKVCGILAEFVASPSPAVVVGMGVNVSQARDEFPVDTATSLALVGVAVTRAEVVRAVLEQLAVVYADWDANGWGAVRSAYEAQCVTLGRHVRVELPDGSAVTGVATAVLDDGRIVVGSQTFAAGDVHHLRPL